MKFRVLSFCLLYPIIIANAQYTGLSFENEEAYKSIPLAAMPARGEIPDVVDMSEHFPQPGNQGKQGSCVGWATGYALKGYLEIKERKWSGTSDDERFSPAYIYNQIKLPGGGAYVSSALDLLLREGVVKMSDFPYSEKNDSKVPSKELKKKAREFAISSWRRLDPKLIDSVKGHLASGFPVVIAMDLPKSFKKYQGGVYSEKLDEKSAGGHAMCVLGYSDTKNAVKIINSWGTSWGEIGFVWVDYKTFTNRVKEAYVVQDVIVYHPDRPKVDPEGFDPRPTVQQPWVFVNSSKERIRNNELRVRSVNELWRARNEIYARHGYVFKTKKGKAYTESLGNHYNSKFENVSDVEARFNKFERYNVAIIRATELARPTDDSRKNPWVFADSSMRRLSVSEISMLDKEELWRARNEIFARNGYKFTTRKGKDFTKFMGAIYQPISSDMSALYANFSAIEKYNVELIAKTERIK